jgi:hypothetical protein
MGLFFDRQSSATALAHSFHRTGRQFFIQFLSASPNGLNIQTRDLG